MSKMLFLSEIIFIIRIHIAEKKLFDGGEKKLVVKGVYSTRFNVVEAAKCH